MNKCPLGIVLLCAVALLCSDTRPLIGGEVVLEKLVGAGVWRVSFTKEKVPEALWATWARSDPKWKPVCATELRLELTGIDSGAALSLWTNRNYTLPGPDAHIFATHIVFDVIAVKDVLLVCYKEGSVMFSEAVPTQHPAGRRERCLLTRDASLVAPNSWTNATFHLAPDGAALLTAKSDSGAKLVWEYRNDEWAMELEQCKPEAVRRSAYNWWCMLSYEGERWVATRRHTGSMPELSSITNTAREDSKALPLGHPEK